MYDAEKLDVAIRDQQRRLEFTELNLDTMQELYEATRGFTDRHRIPADWAPCVAKQHNEIETKLEQAEQDTLELRRTVRERGASPTTILALSGAGGSNSFIKKKDLLTQQMEKELAELDSKKKAVDGQHQDVKKAIGEREASVAVLRAAVAQKKAELGEKKAKQEEQQKKKKAEDEAAAAALVKSSSLLATSNGSSSSSSFGKPGVELLPAVTKAFIEQLSHLAVCDSCPTSQKTLLLRKMCEYCGLLPREVLAAAGKKPMVTDMSTISFSGMPFGDSIACLVCLVLRHHRTANTSSKQAAPPPITSICIGDCGVTDSGAKHLAVALNDLPSPVTLRGLSLISNSFTIEAVIHLLGALISNRHISEFVLDLSSNDFFEREGAGPARCMELNQYLMALKAAKPMIEVEMPTGAPVSMRRTGSVVGC